MLIATWNVNSIRARLERLLAFLGRHSPDVVCLQELKVADADFPEAEIAAAGYRAVYHGQATYNGVAILSKDEATGVDRGMGDEHDDDQARLIAATVAGVRFISAYFPNGKTVGSDKWSYKLEWMGRLRGYLERQGSRETPLALCGDFNVAPEDRDVARPDEWRESVLCHADARTALGHIAGFGLIDTLRLHDQGPGPYSWWDYRMLGFPKGNGLRIDHVYATKSLADRTARAWVDRNERKGKLPSDHAPVLVEVT